MAWAAVVVAHEGRGVSFTLCSVSNPTPVDCRCSVREVLRFVELEHTIDMRPSELSGGMQRRVAIARAVINRPPLVLYDSPTAGLDPVTAQAILTLILRLRDILWHKRVGFAGILLMMAHLGPHVFSFFAKVRTISKELQKICWNPQTRMFSGFWPIFLGRKQRQRSI